jgi:hypothetical protein
MLTVGLDKSPHTFDKLAAISRLSLLDARAEKTAGTVTATYIGGACVPVMRGVLDLA